MGMFDDLVPNQTGAAAPQPPLSYSVAPTNAGTFNDLIPESGGYRFNTLPLYRDAKGGYSPAVPGVVKNLYDTAVSGFTAPGDAYTGQLPTPYTNTPIAGDQARTSAGLEPRYNANIDPAEANGRAFDFASMFSPQSVATRAGEYVPGTLTTEQAPTAQQLKGAASAGYDAARASGATVPGDAVAAMSQQLQQTLQGDHGVIAKTAPKTFAILDELANPPAGGMGTYSGLEAARRGLSAIAGEGGTEGFAAQKAIGGLNPFIDSVAPQAADARANYAAAQRSNTISGELSRGNTGFAERADAAAHASHSGANFDNNLRQRVKNFLQNENNLGGFSQAEIDALNDVVKGSLTQNTARYAGNVLGGGGGLGGAIAGLAAGHYLGNGELGMALGLGAGRATKGLENTLARRSLNRVDEMVRMRSPLADALQTEGLLAQPALGRNSAVLRSILPGLLGMASQPAQPATPGILDFIRRGGA
jgi:hypothetical protein